MSEKLEKIKRMNLLPKCQSIVIKKYYCERIVSPYITLTSDECWIGKKKYKWLWYNFEKKFTKFYIEDGKLIFTKKPKKGVEISVTH